MEEAGEDGEPKKEAKEEEDEKLHVPAALSVTNGVQEQIKEYRVSGAQIWNYRGMKITQTYIGLEVYLCISKIVLIEFNSFQFNSI